MPETYSFSTLLNEQMNDVYSAEKQIAEAIPKMIAVASSGELRDDLNHYLEEVRTHLDNLDQCFREMKLTTSNAGCPPISGILEEAQHVIDFGGNSAVKDAALIAIMQRIQHYKMAAYGTGRTFARHLNFNNSMELLQRALNEEGEADRRLTRIAEGGLFTTGINEEACRT